jgi:hypothetical protein
LFAETALDAHLQGHGAAGATVAGAVEANLHYARRRDVDQFDIASIGLNCRANQVDHFLNALTQWPNRMG